MCEIPVVCLCPLGVHLIDQRAWLTAAVSAVGLHARRLLTAELHGALLPAADWVPYAAIGSERV